MGFLIWILSSNVNLVCWDFIFKYQFRFGFIVCWILEVKILNFDIWVWIWIMLLIVEKQEINIEKMMVANNFLLIKKYTKIKIHFFIHPISSLNILKLVPLMQLI